MSRRKPLWDSELTVLAAFVLVVAGGFAYCLANLVWPDMFARLSEVRSEIAAAPQAPTVSDYMSESSAVMKPFLTQAIKLTADDLSVESETTKSLSDLAAKTQELLIKVRVPKEFRDTHLSCVLLLEQWKRALSGSSADRAVVLEHTNDLIAGNPWLMQ